MEIEKLNWDETLGIRHQVLWPNEDVSYCKVAGDESALHFGVKYNNVRVCVASIYTNSYASLIMSVWPMTFLVNKNNIHWLPV
jgi:hypothetical protein